jgi:transposase
MSKRRKFRAEFKRGAVEQASQPGVCCARVARALGIRDPLLTRWKREAQHPERPLSAAPGRHGTKRWLDSSASWRE